MCAVGQAKMQGGPPRYDRLPQGGSGMKDPKVISEHLEGNIPMQSLVTRFYHGEKAVKDVFGPNRHQPVQAPARAVPDATEYGTTALGTASTRTKRTYKKSALKAGKQSDRINA
tara:strand:- start:216 stop:557 length:342 start_codon:yes stop_codon:yes gene_type:complete